MLYAENGMFDQEGQSYHLQINTTLLQLLDQTNIFFYMCNLLMLSITENT